MSCSTREDGTADIPSDYFANFKGCTSEMAPFLGGSMVAKVS